MSTSDSFGRELDGEGEVDGHTIQVFREMTSRGMDYTFRIVKGDKIVYADDRRFDTNMSAFDAGVAWIIPDAVAVEFNEPRTEDYGALNALLYCGGLMMDLASISDVTSLHAGFARAIEVIPQIKKQAREDFIAARDILSSTHGPFHSKTIALGKLMETFDAQCDVLLQISERNFETAGSFLQEFLK